MAYRVPEGSARFLCAEGHHGATSITSHADFPMGLEDDNLDTERGVKKYRLSDSPASPLERRAMWDSRNRKKQ